MAGTPKYLKKKFRDDPRMIELIDALWPTSYALYKERKLQDLTIDTEANPEYKYKASAFGEDVSMSVALGHGHELYANLSAVLGGYGSITRAFRETLMGSYPEDLEGNPDEWDELDRLWAVGIGTSDSEREDAIRLFKSGFVKFIQAVQVGKYAHGDLDAPDGTVQYTPEKELEYRHEEEWVQARDKHYRHTQGVPAKVWNITHNLGKLPSVTVSDTSGTEYEGEVQHIDDNNCVLTFSAAFSGYADLN